MDVYEWNAITGEVASRPFTEEEKLQHEAMVASDLFASQKAIDDAAAHEAALESGRAKLLALGLTEDEVAAMTNG